MKPFLISAYFILAFLFKINAQSIDSVIEKYGTDYAQERAYLHYDKSTYAPGETIWFKAYLLQGILPVNESKTFYIDWTDDNGNLLAHNLAPLLDGTAYGQFDIPAAYAGKFIHIKAYTKWMLNFDSAFLYNNDIRILSKTGITQGAKITIVPSLQFFPEGGDIVAGVTNKVAFKANDQFGRPINIKGIVQNNAGAMVDSLRVIHDGMGYFFISPNEGETFNAKWSVKALLQKDEKGTEHNSPLPVVKSEGVSLQVLP
nr:hypothetical protein [Bacteroidota bacterium]